MEAGNYSSVFIPEAKARSSIKSLCASGTLLSSLPTHGRHRGLIYVGPSCLLQWKSQRDGIFIEMYPHIDTTGGTAVAVMDDHVIAAGMHHAKKIADAKLH
jgi:hypothetical protein